MYLFFNISTVGYKNHQVNPSQIISHGNYFHFQTHPQFCKTPQNKPYWRKVDTWKQVQKKKHERTVTRCNEQERNKFSVLNSWHSHSYVNLITATFFIVPLGQIPGSEIIRTVPFVVKWSPPQINVHGIPESSVYQRLKSCAGTRFISGSPCVVHILRVPIHATFSCSTYLVLGQVLCHVVIILTFLPPCMTDQSGYLRQKHW